MAEARQSSYLDELNTVQRQAVEHMDGPVMVIAGPGSGKTRVLTYRIAHLIHQGVAPWKILTLTFTNKAAREMKERIERVVGERARSVWAGTFHSLFARILRVEAEALGFPKNFTIYDTDDSRNLVKRIVNDLKLDKKIYNPNTIRNRISAAKSKLITATKYGNNIELLTQDKMNRMPYLSDIYKMYEKRCVQAGAMDFDDLLLQMYILLEKNPDIAQKYQRKFSHVLVDEFQDTNHLQYAIVRQLVDYPDSGHNICIVGDDAQSIYAFRGATIDNILEFSKDFENVKTYKLEQNYRSTPHIVKAANAVIANNTRQLKKEIWTDNDEGNKIKIIKTHSDKDEGKRIADLILEHKNRDHIPNSEIAILYRTNAQSRVFEEYLRRYNIPYRIFGGLSFYQRKEIKDIIAYLRLIVNPKDNEAFLRIVNFPKRAIGDATSNSIEKYAVENDKAILAAAVSCPLASRARTAVDRFLGLMKHLIDYSRSHDAYETTVEVVKKTKILEKLKEENTVENNSRIDNINSLLDAVQAFVDNDELSDIQEENSDDRSLAGYLQNVALITDADQESDEQEYVTLMSTHAAKGLEFDSIFLVGMEENLFPSFRSMDSQEQIDEERRLFYVAITRARKYLTITYADNRYYFGDIRRNAPSRFLEEIDDSCVERSGEYGINNPVRTNPSAAGRSSVKGMLLHRKPNRNMNIDAANFKASPAHLIQNGMTVRHLKFGQGKVIHIDGDNEKRVATIFFQGIDQPERRILLKFAKLEIVEE